MRLIPIATAAIVILAGCSSQESAPESASGTTDAVTTAIPEVSFHAHDFGYDGPDTIPSGVTAITLVNDGPSPHELILVRVDSGHTYAEIAQVALKGDTPEWMSVVGGDGVIRVGQADTTISDLQPGIYALLCFIQDALDKPPHFMLGMARTLTVTAERNSEEPPIADATIKLVDYGFEMPDLKAGEHTLQIVNGGKEYHQIDLVRIPEGKTMKDVIAAEAPGSPQVGEIIGGNGALSPGASNWWRVNLPAGKYVAMCYIPSPDGKPHYMEGMVKEFTVS